MTFNLSGTAIGLVASVMSALTATAQEAEEAGEARGLQPGAVVAMEEKRAESLQDMPISIAALSGETRPNRGQPLPS